MKRLLLFAIHNALLISLTLFLSTSCVRRAYAPHFPPTRTDYPPLSVHQEGYRGLIVIDAGHGGDDEGTHSVDRPRVAEKQLTLSTAKLVKIFLEQEGYQVVMTRQGDFSVPLKTRALFANDIRAQLFASIHYNSAPSRQAAGTEIYYYNGEDNKKRTQASKAFAQRVLDEIVGRIHCENRGVRHGNFAVIRETQMPAILIEAAFMSNPEEMQKLRDPRYEQKIAQAIAHAIDLYCSRRDSNARPVA